MEDSLFDLGNAELIYDETIELLLHFSDFKTINISHH